MTTGRGRGGAHRVSRETSAARHAAAVARAVGLGQLRGALVHACTDSRRCIGDNGFPDVFMAGPFGQLAAEIKTGLSARPSPGQNHWLWTLRAGHCTALLLREHELAEGGPLDAALIRIMGLDPIPASAYGSGRSTAT